MRFHEYELFFFSFLLAFLLALVSFGDNSTGRESEYLGWAVFSDSIDNCLPTSRNLDCNM